MSFLTCCLAFQLLAGLEHLPSVLSYFLFLVRHFMSAKRPNCPSWNVGKRTQRDRIWPYPKHLFYDEQMLVPGSRFSLLRIKLQMKHSSKVRATMLLLTPP
ncbi:hypothetical protein EDB82DRAFT_110166 [Fusarium venenatum]|uniref:uncharacterized protein n=1 Tax=Fusarium venenatum TaxID=56646 RepID=UPI001D6F568D|nr:hypothetical protein EDB82DRAFT_110166 [Fusarium venenatum]